MHEGSVGNRGNILAWDKPWKKANVQEVYLICTSQLGQSARAEHQNRVGKWVAAEGDATKRYGTVYDGKSDRRSSVSSFSSLRIWLI